jgi:hypothetical protein
MKIDPYLLELESDPEKAAAFFAPVIKDEDSNHIAELNAKILAGQAELYRLRYKDGEEAGFIALEETETELWIAALAVLQSKANAKRIAADVETEARRRGKKYLMFKTIRPGLIQQMQEIGFYASEVTMRKRL